MGATGEYQTRTGAKVQIHLVSNPSHLEAVDPVTVGRTRAKQDRAGEVAAREISAPAGSRRRRIRGPGHRGRDPESFRHLQGYTVGGTIHVIVNNLLGFTTVLNEEHSSRFSAQLARRQSIPIFHVNARRSGRRGAGGSHCRGIPLHLRQRRGYRLDRLPPPRPQRSRRSHRHSAAVVQSIKDHPPLWEIYAEDIGAEDVQARVEQFEGRIGSRSEERQVGYARSRSCGICRTIGTTTMAAATSPSTKSIPAFPPRSLPK